MGKYCIVCRGDRVVRLPLFHPMDVTQSEIPKELPSSHREYPCPECTEQVSIERLYVFKHESWRNNDIDDPQYQKSVREDCAHAMIHGLLDRGLIRFDTAIDTMGYGITASMAVASPIAIETIEQRTQQHQTVVARAAADIAIKDINHFGSHHGYTHVYKTVAIDAINQAIDAAVKQFKERWKKDG